MVKESWSKVSDMTVARCWIKYKILSTAMDAELSAIYGNMRNDRSELVRSMMDDFKKFSLPVSTNKRFMSQISSDVDYKTMERWVIFENVSIIQTAMGWKANDDANLIMEKDIAQSTVTHTLNAGDADKEADYPIALPRMAEILYHCNVSISFLRKTKTALSKAKKKLEPEHGRQILISMIL